MKNKVIFLDRDGTINVDHGYVYELNKLEFIDGVIDALSEFINLGYKLIIISNQSGVSRGYYTIEEMNKFNLYMCEKLKENGIPITDIYCCPHLNEECECRKPKLKMFWDAIKKYNIDLDNSFAIGDNERDLSICDITNIEGILFSDKISNKYVTYNNYKDIVHEIKTRS